MLKNHQELNMQVKILLFSLLWTLTFSCKSSPPPQESCDYFTMNKFNKLLVATGVPYANGRNVEVIDLDNPSKTCILSADFPYELRDAVGGFTSCGPMVCSGHYGSYYSADCYSLRSNGQFVKMSELTMDTPRSDASSIVTEDGKLMISGGWNGGRLADTEIINVLESKTEDGFELPNGISDHCSVLINTTTVMVLGGYDGLLTQKSTYFINLETLQVTDGPEMQEARRYFGCAVFEHNQHNFVIAAGGFPSTDSTEFLQLEATRLRWSKGKTNLNNYLDSTLRIHNNSYILINSLNFQDLHCLSEWLTFR